MLIFPIAALALQPPTEIAERVAPEPPAVVFSGGLLVAERQPDLLFLDVQMDGLDGLEVCRRLRANPSLSSVRVVVLSGYLTPESQKGFRELGVESCHSKPVAPQVIHELLAEHLPPARDAVISSLVGHGEA